jgi:hypothetical protein
VEVGGGGGGGCSAMGDGWRRSSVERRCRRAEEVAAGSGRTWHGARGPEGSSEVGGVTAWVRSVARGRRAA